MTTGPASTEDQLREVLDKLANGVQPAPDAYRRVQGEWRRRERRRRIILAILVVLVLTIADIVGLWALNQYQDQSRIAPGEPVPARSHAPPAVDLRYLPVG
ncbi:hypothetical protein OG884_22900 [Streptosporangium sp. NBC_01755]|uniref:hypothetical protein n=1 Tax=unclassified Streptosporangium TaxID=2632669 RepID=UPI002DD86457|nr:MULTISPECIES: hypothetical protein [unclassified Streptosporangium]WSA24186.1 hypothetical protein OIE13_25015 [Streptosporangium sp. NBC_01810]WSC97738.1 hypothetical protein OG884_22900 [Streptosporangium sp. NBC_01755]